MTNAELYVIVVKHLRESIHAGVAQLVEQLICNQQVGGSSPSTSSNKGLRRVSIIDNQVSRPNIFGRIPEWPKGADCKSVASCFGGLNPPSPTSMSVDNGLKLSTLIFFSFFLQQEQISVCSCYFIWFFFVRRFSLSDLGTSRRGDILP